jgi:acetyltransferase-like isoleucine patch superfamily enzyme
MSLPFYTHPSSDVSRYAVLGQGTRVWNGAQIREGARIGENCTIGKDVYVDVEVVVGDNVKIQNAAQLYRGVTVEDGVFIGPRACLTNDRYPRAITPEGRLKNNDDWELGRIRVRHGASLGAASVVLPDVEVGRFALVAAGSVVTRSIPDHALVVGVPGRVTGYACVCGYPLEALGSAPVWICGRCHWRYDLSEQS